MNAANIRATAIDHFARVGYHGASLRQIATDAGVALGTLYHYYPSKQDLLAELMTDALQPLIDSGTQVREEFVGDPLRQLFEAVRRFVVISLEAPERAIIADIELRSLTGANRTHVVGLRDAYENVIRAIVLDGVSSANLRPGDVKLATFAVLAVANQPAYWYRADGEFTPGEIALTQALLAVRLMGVSDTAIMGVEPTGELAQLLEASVATPT